MIIKDIGEKEERIGRRMKKDRKEGIVGKGKERKICNKERKEIGERGMEKIEERSISRVGKRIKELKIIEEKILKKSENRIFVIKREVKEGSLMKIKKGSIVNINEIEWNNCYKKRLK